MNRVAKEVVQNYAACGLYSHLYATLRWRFCPYEEMNALLPREGTLIDVGCGEGLFANYLAASEPRRRVIGVDANAKRIRQAAKAGRRYPNVSFHHGDVRTFDMPTSAAAFTMADVLH